MELCPKNKKLEIGVFYELNFIAYPTPRAMIPSRNWDIIRDRIWYLIYDLHNLPSRPVLYSIDGSPFRSLEGYDARRKLTKSGNGALLSDLLPLVRQEGKYYNHGVYELSDP